MSKRSSDRGVVKSLPLTDLQEEVTLLGFAVEQRHDQSAHPALQLQTEARVA
jgi:hypothetical protein